MGGEVTHPERRGERLPAPGQFSGQPRLPAMFQGVFGARPSPNSRTLSGIVRARSPHAERRGALLAISSMKSRCTSSLRPETFRRRNTAVI